MRGGLAVSLPLFAFLDDAEPIAGPCRHTRTTTSAVHQRGSNGGSCNHDETCDACGLLVGTESWNLALAAAKHAEAYPEAA
jgi:hypothetical protein